MYTTTNHVNYCEGTDQIVHGSKMDNTIIYDQLRIKIMQTTIYSERNKRLISNTDMSFLPTTCNAHHGVSFTQDATYIWDIESYHSNFDFTFYKQASFHMIEPRTYIGKGNKILIRFPETKTTTIICDDRKIYQTEEGIWVSERPKTKRFFRTASESKWNMTDSPDLHQMMEVSTNFLIYSINNKLSLTHNNLRTTQCRFQNRLQYKTYEHIQDNTFIRDLGDSLADN